MAPSLFNGQFGEALKESFDRIRFGGQTYGERRVYYINLQEIKGLKFGTRTPVNYFDSFYKDVYKRQDIKYLRPTMPWTDWRSWKRRRSTWCSWIS